MRTVQLGFFTIVALVALRVSVGWHFYKEGAKKLHDPAGFTSAHFLRQATGPWKDYFRGIAPQPHGWDTVLVEQQNRPLDPQKDAAELQKMSDWFAAQKKAAEEAKKAGKSYNPEVPPFAAYAPWAERILADWHKDLQQLQRGLSTEKQAQAGDIYTDYRARLLEYFDSVEAGVPGEDAPTIAKYRHELWRLSELEKKGESNDVPYFKKRITDKQTETKGMVAPWVAEVAALENSFHADLAKLLDGPISWSDSASQEGTSTLRNVDRLVPYWHIAVGAGLMLGLFSRLAGFGAAAFILMVLATQPPWAPDAADTYYQLVEFSAALVLTCIPTGRWAGLDFFIHALTSRCCTRT